MRLKTFFGFLLALSSLPTFAGEIREVQDQSGKSYWVDMETHRVLSRIIVDAHVVWVDSGRNYYPPADSPPSGPPIGNLGVPLDASSPPASGQPPEPSTGRESDTGAILNSTAPTGAQGEGYSPTDPLSPTQQAQVVQAVNELFGPGIPVRDHTASENAARQNTDLRARADAEAGRIQGEHVQPHTLTPDQPTEEQIRKYRTQTIIDVPSVPDPLESQLPYSFQYRGAEREHLLRLYKHLYKISPETGKRKNARELGLMSVEEADSSFAGGDAEQGKFYTDLAESFLDLAIGLDPITGIARSSYELVTGRNFVTGAALQKWEYGFAALNVVTLGSEGFVGNTFKGLAKIVSRAGRFVRIPELTAGGVRVAERVIESAGTLLGRAPLKSEVEDLVAIAKAAEKEGRALEDIGEAVGKGLDRFGPMRKGPLHFIKLGTGTVAETFRSASYFERRLEKPLKLYRVYSEDGKYLGKFWTFEKPSGPLQAMIDSALDPEWGNKATHWIEITVPPGEVIYEGFSSEMALERFSEKFKVGNLLGGGSQVYINKEIIPESWITGKGRF